MNNVFRSCRNKNKNKEMKLASLETATDDGTTNVLTSPKDEGEDEELTRSPQNLHSKLAKPPSKIIVPSKCDNMYRNDTSNFLSHKINSFRYKRSP